MPFALSDLTVPLVGAPMAGGPGTPALAAAVTNAGGLGFLPAGYLSAQRLADDIAVARSATTGPLGVNLFVPRESHANPMDLVRYAAELSELAARFDVEPGASRWDDDDWTAKLDVVAELRPEVVSFTFALPEPAVITRLRDLGILTLMTVTTLDESRAAVASGVDGLVLQGPEAGGHRGTWSPTGAPSEAALSELLPAATQLGVPLIAAGGLGSAADVASAVRVGACAAQLGTALLLADEAGTNATYRNALTSGEFTETVVTKAFSGRYARGLANEFARRYDGVAPFGYPEVHFVTSPIRKAAVAAGDPNATNLWAGTAFAAVRPGTTAAVLDQLTP